MAVDFKINDIVRLRNNSAMGAKPGALARITKMDDTYLWVDWIARETYFHSQQNGNYQKDKFDLAYRFPFKVGDKVVYKTNTLTDEQLKIKGLYASWAHVFSVGQVYQIEELSDTTGPCPAIRVFDNAVWVNPLQFELYTEAFKVGDKVVYRRGTVSKADEIKYKNDASYPSRENLVLGETYTINSIDSYGNLGFKPGGWICIPTQFDLAPETKPSESTLPFSREEYLLKQNLCGIKAGDTVVVERAYPNHAHGWQNTWVERMHEMVGKSYVVSHTSKNSGISVNGFCFPYFALTKQIPGKSKDVAKPSYKIEHYSVRPAITPAKQENLLLLL